MKSRIQVSILASAIAGLLPMVVVTMCGLLVTSGANAASYVVVNADFNTDSSSTYSGSGADPTLPGSIWNGVKVSDVVAGPVALPLNSIGGASAVTIQFPSSFGVISSYDNATAPSAPALLDDYAYVGGSGNFDFTIGGLTSGGVYDLYLYSQNGVSQNQDTLFSVNGGSPVAVNNAAISGFSAGVNYLFFPGVIATGGVITGNAAFTTPSGANPSFNGFQLVQIVPEPASMTLLASGGLLLLRRRSRRAA